MGFFTEDKPTLAEGLRDYGEGLKKYADAQRLATYEAEDARKHEAKMQKRAEKHEKDLKERAEKHEKDLKERAENSERATEYSAVAQEGTAEAYRKLYHAHFTEVNRQVKNYVANSSLKKSLTMQQPEKGYDNQVNEKMNAEVHLFFRPFFKLCLILFRHQCGVNFFIHISCELKFLFFLPASAGAGCPLC